MRFILIFTALVAFFSVSVTSIKARPSLGRASRHESSRSVLLEAVNYLEKYGYLDIGNDIQHADDARLVVAIQRMQSFFRLPATGQPDRHTLEMMRQPRCGCPDVVDTSDAVVIDQGMMPQQYKNAGLGSTFRWFHTDLNYTFLNFPSGEGALQPDDVRKTMRKAFKQWSDVTPLTFSEVTEPSHGADIKIQFGRRNHNPKEPRLRYFDGPGGDIAHAYLPNSNWGDLDGDIHFDDEDMFTSDGKEGFALLLIGVHEIGHSLGMSHSYMENSVMWPSYRYVPVKGYMLPEYDVAGIQSIYGPRQGPLSKPGEGTVDVSVGRRPTGPKDGQENKRLPDAVTSVMCQEPFTALLKIDTELFAFRDNMVWRIRISDRQLLSPTKGEPAKRYWKGIPSRITAAYQRHDGNVVFFKGDKLFVYRGKKRVGNPVKISTMGVNRPPMAALRAGRHAPNKIYLLRGNEVWLYDEGTGSVDVGFPMAVGEVWENLPSGVTGGEILDDGTTFFLKGNRYFEVDNDNRVTSPRGGQSNLFSINFLGCRNL